MTLSQSEMDHMLALGDTYPIKDTDSVRIKFEVKTSGTDERIWWGNSPLPTERAHTLLLAGLERVVPAT